MKQDTVLFLDIGSSSVGATLVKTENKIPKILFSLREPIKIFENVDIDLLFGHGLKALDILLHKLKAKKIEVPSKVQCVLSSPWYISEFRKIIFKKNTPFVFDNKMASDILAKEAELFKRERYDVYGDLEDGMVVPIEMKTLRTVLNGYDTDHPYGHKARELQLDIFISLGSKMFIEKIKEVVHNHFTEMKIGFSSFAFHSFASARDMFPNKDMILLTVGGEVSDVLIIKNNSMNSLISFPIGSNHFIRQVSRNNNIPFNEAMSLIGIYNEGHANKSLSLEMFRNIVQFEKDWLGAFERNLFENTEDISLPYIVFVMAENGFSNLFTKMVANENMNQYDWTEKKFKISHLPLESLKNLSFNRFVC